MVLVGQEVVFLEQLGDVLVEIFEAFADVLVLGGEVLVGSLQVLVEGHVGFEFLVGFLEEEDGCVEGGDLEAEVGVVFVLFLDDFFEIDSEFFEFFELVIS